MPEEPTKQPTEFTTGYCIHGEDVYSLDISIEDRHITLTRYPYLGNRILEQAFIIKQVVEESRKKGGKGKCQLKKNS